LNLIALKSKLKIWLREPINLKRKKEKECMGFWCEQEAGVVGRYLKTEEKRKEKD